MTCRVRGLGLNPRLDQRSEGVLSSIWVKQSPCAFTRMIKDWNGMRSLKAGFHQRRSRSRSRSQSRKRAHGLEKIENRSRKQSH